MSARAEFAVLGLILLIAAVLRFTSIGSRSLWFDEAFAFDAANRPPATVIAFAAQHDTHPPLYYLLLSLWMRAFGASEAALRSLGALVGTLTIAGVWWLGRRVGGPKVGMLAALVTAVAPFPILAAQEARMYPLLGFLTVCSWVGLVAATDGRRWGWIAYVVASALALYTHYFAFLTLLGQGLYLMGAAPRARRPWAASMVALFVLFLPWLRTFVDTVLSGKGWPFFRPPIGVQSLTDLLGFWSFGGHLWGFAGYHEQASASVASQLAVLAPFVFLSGAGLLAIRQEPKDRWLLVAFLSPAIIALVFSLWRNIFYARYFSYVFPAYAILLVLGIQQVAVWLRRVSRPALLGLIAGVLGVNVFVLTEVQANPAYNYYNWRDVGALLAANAGPDDLIVAFPGHGVVPLSYYFKGAQRIEQMTPREYLDVTGGKVKDDPAVAGRNVEIIRSYAARHRVMWIVATRPLPEAAMRRLVTLLEGIYDYRGGADFKGISVFKAARNPAWNSSR
ncbi:MAG: glycosyltransferase family 39 protein [Armatimonadota bacterium]